jgi:hypothetical protein
MRQPLAHSKIFEKNEGWFDARELVQGGPAIAGTLSEEMCLWR